MKKISGGTRIDGLALDPDYVGIAAVDNWVDVEANKHSLDAKRLDLLDESDPAIIALAHSIIAMKKNVQSVALAYALDKKGERITDKEGKFRVIAAAGRRRTFAMRLANKWLRARGAPTLMLRCTWPEAGDAADLYGLMLVENRHRVEDSPRATAQGIAEYVTMLGGDPENPTKYIVDRIAAELGYDESSVRGYLTFGSLPKEVQQMAEEKRADGRPLMPMYALNEIAKLEGTKEEKVALAQKVAAEDAPRVIRRTSLEVQKANATKRAAKNGSPTPVKPDDRHVGLTNRQKRGVIKLYEADIKAGKTPELDETVVKAFRVDVGDIGTATIKGLNGYLNRLVKKPKEAAGKDAE